MGERHVSTYAKAATVASWLDSDYFSNAVWTKFVRASDEYGNSTSCYENWNGCQQDSSSPIRKLATSPANHDHVLALPTSSIRCSELKVLIADTERQIIYGAATDRCVLSTILGTVGADKKGNRSCRCLGRSDGRGTRVSHQAHDPSGADSGYHEQCSSSRSCRFQPAARQAAIRQAQRNEEAIPDSLPESLPHYLGSYWPKDLLSPAHLNVYPSGASRLPPRSSRAEA